MKAYSVIAKIYDNANTDFDYSSYYDFTKHYLTEKVVELACGSGAFTSYLLKSADSIIAVDNSHEMLEIAISNNFKNRQYIHFVEDDMQNFMPPSKVNSVVSVCDGFNYINPKDIGKVFERICGYLKNGGYFVFDISSEYKLINLIGNNVFYEDNDDYTYLWTNRLGNNFVEMEIAMFERAGEVYKRSDEKHVQYFHNEDNLKGILSNLGFEVSIFDGENFKEYNDKSMRLLFICKKIK